jgi:hypothetical protein
MACAAVALSRVKFLFFFYPFLFNVFVVFNWNISVYLCMCVFFVWFFMSGFFICR